MPNKTVAADASVNAADNEATTQKKVPFAVAEAYKSIRTNLISLLEKDGKR